jgi:hypothetical protein
VNTFIKHTLVLGCTILISMVLIYQTSYSLTLDEAISLSKETLPFYKASMIRTRSTEALYSASLGPYIPSLDASTVQQRFYTSRMNFRQVYDVTLSYTLLTEETERHYGILQDST